MNKIRVTKYNPLFRDEEGRYLKKEWTSYSEVGKSFFGIKFLLEDYNKIEKKYINAIYKLIQSRCPCSLKISKLEKYGNTSELEANNDFDLIDSYNNVVDFYEIDSKDPILEFLIKLTLREYIWLELSIINTPIKITFGYDYYMYFSGLEPNEAVIRQIENTGLFVEKLSSIAM